MAKVLILNGSPREKGNTAFLVEKLSDKLMERGHSVDVLRLHGLDIKPCRGCFWCYQGFPLRCVQDDAMNHIYPVILESDVLVFASPIYWFNYSAQLKLFVDRLVALHIEGGHALDGTRFATLFVYGDRDPIASGVYTAIESIEHMISYFKGENLANIHGTGGDNLRARKPSVCAHITTRSVLLVSLGGLWVAVCFIRSQRWLVLVVQET